MLTRVKKVLVTNKEAASTSGATPNTIATGDIIPFNGAFTEFVAGDTITSGANNNILFLACGSEDGTVITSTPINLKQVTRVTLSDYLAPVEKVMRIGYNGTSGTITTPSNNQEWRFIIAYKDDQRFQNQRMSRSVVNYVTDSVASTLELVSHSVGLMNDSRDKRTKVEMITNGTATLAAVTATASYDSKTIITSAAPAFAVGDVIRIGTNTTTTGAYVVRAINGTIVTLSSKYQGTSGAGLSINVMTAITAYGIQITGIKIPYNGIDLYQKCDFDCFLSPVLGPTDNAEAKAVSVQMVEGNGYWQQVRDEEYLANAWRGDTNRMMFPVKSIQLNTHLNDDSYTYRIFTVEYFDEHNGDLQGQYKSPMSAYVAFKTTAGAASANETDFLARITPLLTSAGIVIV